uniref:Uncharacterized protein n=1 Tax=Arcella intermedia TaxID=1963864 RepID=A0A6B2LUQ6_9EUKA
MVVKLCQEVKQMGAGLDGLPSRIKVMVRIPNNGRPDWMSTNKCSTMKIN